MLSRIPGLILTAVVLLPGLVRSDAMLRGTAESLREAEPVSLGDVPLFSGRLLADAYKERGYRLAWTAPERIDALLRLIEDSPADGFEPKDFHVGSVRALARLSPYDRFTDVERVSADLKLSDALLRYIHHHRFGKLDPNSVNRPWNHRDAIPADPLVKDLQAALAADDLTEHLASAFPRPFFYENLRRAMRGYADAAHLKGLPPVPTGRNLVRGDRGSRVALVRERLRLIGDSGGPASGDPDLFDDGLHEAVVDFQRRVGLTPDGVVGPATVAALSTPYDEANADRIRINLERMRWLYNDLPDDYVLVDVADYMVHVVRDKKVSWSTRIVVGTPDQQTPMFRDQMEHLVFNPTWTVPPSIQKKMRGVSSRYKVVDRRTGRAVRGVNVSDHRRYRLVQEAGPGNALGRVKFMFPNGHAVYLHDTPSKGLFSHRTRTYSHGCVRVQNPLKLAEEILDEPAWNQSAIKRVVGTSRTRYVQLDDQLPVLLYYLTAFGDDEGKVSFRRDVYGRDGDLRRALAGDASEPRLSFPEPLEPAQNTDSEEAPTQAYPPAPPPPTPPEGVKLSDNESLGVPMSNASAPGPGARQAPERSPGGAPQTSM